MDSRKATNATDPVKLIPARSEQDVIVSPKTGPSAGMKFMTPAGIPASLIALNTI